MQVNFNPINLLGLNKNLGYAPKYNLPKLQQLSCDTVSFSGRRELVSHHMTNAPSQLLCTKVSDAAEPARYYLQTILDKYINQFTDKSDNKSAKKYPVLDYYTRVKSPSSIREKVVSKYSQLCYANAKEFANEVYLQISRYVHLNPQLSKADAIDTILEVIDGIDESGAPLAYTSIPMYLRMSLSALENMNFFDSSAYSYEKKVEIINKIISDIQTKRDNMQLPEISPTTIDGVKYYANDIVGARIILRDNDASNTSKVIDAIKQAVENNELKITSIENNLPDEYKLSVDDNISNYSYAKDPSLHSLAAAADAELDRKPSKSGYTAIHINVDLSNPELSKINPNFDGYQGEIQIIGRDVAQLKEVEDLCYKLKDNKNALREEYRPFKELFLKLYSGETKKHFDDYTFALYLSQRRLDTVHRRSIFPTLAQMGFEKTIPPQLDFNALQKVKEFCDVDIKRHDQMENSQFNLLSPLLSKTSDFGKDIKDAKSIISFLIK